MNNLFSIFDPISSIFIINLNWLRIIRILFFIPSSFWVCKRKHLNAILSIFSYLQKEFYSAIQNLSTPGIVHFFIRIFLFIVLNNFLGLFPYIFTASSHLTFRISLALTIWLGFILFSTVKNINNFLAHLVPIGTPYILIPFIVIIELIRNVIRPITLSVRLAANIVAGHLLIVLLRTPVSLVSWPFFIVIIIRLLLLLLLELAVSFIQSYVFRTLISLYIIEVNSPNF